MIRLLPSLAAAPMAHLAETISDLEAAGSDGIHFDVEDGIFIPMMTLGTRIIQETRPLTKLPFDVHLCVSNPEVLIPQVVEMGANWVCVHLEACPYPHRILQSIRAKGARAGLAVNPRTPLPELDYLLSVLDYVVVLTTEPEYPDADFLPQMLEKVRQGHRMTDGAPIDWVVDGGVSVENAPLALQAGATALVVGRSVFGGGMIAGNIERLRSAIR